jgi:hypothetical protein
MVDPPPSPAAACHCTYLWHALQFKVDKDGANVGVFDNRTRPHQYSKPGYSGVGAGNAA